MICGDLILKLLDPQHPHSIKLDEMLVSFSRKRFPTGPTHILGGILNIVIVNSDLSQSMTWHMNAPNQHSDHFLLEIHLPMPKPPKHMKLFTVGPEIGLIKTYF